MKKNSKANMMILFAKYIFYFNRTSLYSL